MDDSEENIPVPKVEYIRKTFFETTLGKALIFALIFGSIIILFVLDFFNIISIIPKNQKEQIQNSTIKNLNLLCPVAGFDCGKTKPVKINNQPATGFELPKQSKVISPIAVADVKQFIQSPFQPKSPVGLNQSFVAGDQCYTITYTVPSDANISTITTLPLLGGFQLIILGSDFLNIENSKDLNLAIQLQRRKIPSSDLKKSDQEKCPVYNLKQDQYGNYETIIPDVFKNQ